MRRKKMWLGVGFGVAILGGIGLILGLLVRHEPSFYSRVSLDPGQLRHDNSWAFVRELDRLKNALESHEARWHATFTESQINSFFEENFISSGHADKFLPNSIREPRIAFEQEKLRLGFRYGQGFWSTILSVEFRAWMAPKEPNVIVMELVSIHAGALPVAAQPFLEQLSEVVRGPNIDVTWYRYNGHPTAAIQFHSDKDRPSVVLRQLTLRPGVMTLLGRSLESQPGMSALSCPQCLRPAAN